MILREGVPAIVVSGLAAVVTSALGGLTWSIVPWLLTAWVGWLFWERRPPVPAVPKGVLSPVRGTIVEVAEEHDRWLDRPAKRVRVRVALPGIVPMRSPVEGKIMEVYTRRGVYGRAQRACTAEESPDCYAVWIRTDEGEDVVYAVSSRLPLSRARFDYAPGERVGQGQSSGFFYFASFADVLVPAESSVASEVATAAHAGVTILATLPRG